METRKWKIEKQDFQDKLHAGSMFSIFQFRFSNRRTMDEQWYCRMESNHLHGAGHSRSPAFAEDKLRGNDTRFEWKPIPTDTTAITG